MKKLVSIVMAIALGVSLTGCGGRASAESVVEDAIQAFQNADAEAIEQYWGDTDFSSSNGTAEEDAYAQQLLEQLAENLSYQITEDVSLNLVDNAWKIDPSDTVVNAMMGGLMDSFSLLDESFDTADTVEAPVEPARVNPATLGDYTVEIKSATITQDYAGNPAVVIAYLWTNQSNETTSPFFSVATSVFQDGVGLDSAIIMDDSVYDSSMQTTDVRPGTTIEVQEAFELNNATSPIEVEITEAFLWNDPAEIAYMQFTFD